MTLMKFYGPCEGLFLYTFCFRLRCPPPRCALALLQSWCPNNGKLSEINLFRCRRRDQSRLHCISSVGISLGLKFHFIFLFFFLLLLSFRSFVLTLFSCFRSGTLCPNICTQNPGYLFVNKLAFLKNLHHFLCLLCLLLLLCHLIKIGYKNCLAVNEVYAFFDEFVFAVKAAPKANEIHIYWISSSSSISWVWFLWIGNSTQQIFDWNSVTAY